MTTSRADVCAGGEQHAHDIRSRQSGSHDARVRAVVQEEPHEDAVVAGRCGHVQRGEIIANVVLITIRFRNRLRVLKDVIYIRSMLE